MRWAMSTDWTEEVVTLQRPVQKTPRPPLSGRGAIPINLLGCRRSGSRFLLLLAVLLGGLRRIRRRGGGGGGIGSHRRSGLRHVGSHRGGGEPKGQQGRGNQGSGLIHEISKRWYLQA